MIPPIAFRWTGEAMVPSHQVVADRHFVVGEKYVLVEHQQRSMNSHNHEFAWLAEAWKNLPEHLAERYPSPEHLRKHALIDAGFYVQSQVDAGSNAAAIRIAAFIQAEDVFSVAVVRGPIVIKRVAESQSLRAMGGKRFQESKTAIMDVVAALAGVPADDLRRAAA